MTNQMPLEGFQDHPPHTHEPQPVPTAEPQPLEAVQAGAQAWLAREFVGGMIAMAQSHGVDVADFLADRCVALAMRTASGEAEVEVLRTQLQALTAQNIELQHKVDDCPCHDEDVSVVTTWSGDAVVLNTLPSGPETINGDGR